MTSVWKEAQIRADQIRGSMCAWKDCTATFHDPMPHRWVWLLTYWAPTPKLMPALEVPQRHMPRDAVLCPKHARALEHQLKELMRELNEPAAGTA